uniref:Phosphatidylinositol 3-and 4-kinase domain containing protein n=1 Tax=Babesia bovis TaxID=5865 RepID=S6B860_BABBO|nr:phosphatidylinositol 3- and 4-kinase domain containing protein [Babesia bovis]
MWRYTHILVQFSDTLPTFLRFVDWRDQKETIYALEAMYRWKYPTLGTMLELLSKDFCPPRAPEAIRIYATERIFRKYGIDDLVRVFPQLINAYGSCYVMNRLISLGSKQRTTAIMLYWALETWLRDNDIGYKNQFLRELKNEEHGNDILEGIEAQKLFRDSLRALMKPLNGETISYRKKAEIIAKSFSRSHTADAFYGLDPYVGDDGSTLFNAQIPFFTDPRWEIESLIKDKCRVIKTSKCPLIVKLRLLNLGTDTTREDGSISHNTPTEWRKSDTPMRMEKRVLFKYKDDLRLDQLCQQIAMLCRTVLEGHGVKSYIFTYKVVPTSHNDGFLDIVDETKALSDILNDYGSIGGYVFEDNPSAFEEFCRRLNFVGSLAAYSAITYILGVGDRHNDNLIISRSGHVIHVDYGYILGADPKPLPAAPFKLSKELLKFMGGYNSFLYNKFKMRFYLVYSVLRHHAKLIITMLYLLLDSKLHNVNLDNIIKMESKFFLSANSISTTRKYANNLVESSAIAVSSALAETWHSFAMSWR